MARAASARRAALAGSGDNARYPCGKLKPTHPPATIKRIVESALIRGENPLLGTPIGWLHLHGHLSTKQLSAGAEYARLRGRYDRLMGYPRRSARVLGMLGDEVSDLTEQDAAAIRRHYDTLHAKLTAIGTTKSMGVRIISLLDDVCVDLQAPSWADQALLRIGLDAIADHLRLEPTKARAA